MIGAGVMGRCYMEAADRRGLRVELIEHPSRFDEYRHLAAVQHPVGGRAEEYWTRAAIDVLDSCRPDAVLGFAEPHVLAAATAQARLGLPGASLEAALASRNKGMQRLLFERAGLPQPEFVIGRRPAELLQWAAERFPVVVKPLNGSGSAGVVLAGSTETLSPILAQRTEVSSVLLETYVDGPEYSWEGIVSDGTVRFGNFTAKHTTGPPQFVELAHVLPHAFPARDLSYLEQVIQRAVTAVGMDTGLVHLEFRLGQAGPSIMEVAVRTPGDHIFEMLGIAYGIDFAGILIDLALGLAPDLPGAGPAGPVAAVAFLTSPPGRVERVVGVDEVRRRDDVLRAELRFQPGDVVPELRSSNERCGYVLLRSPDTVAVRRALAEVRRTVRIETSPQRGAPLALPEENK